MSPSQQKSPNPNLTDLRKAVSSLPPRPPEGPVVSLPTQPTIDTSEINSKIFQLEAIVQDLSIDGLLRRKEELENALFVLEKEHLNGLASDNSYYEIKVRVIKELRKLDEKLAQITAYSERNKIFKTEVPEIESALAKLIQSARRVEQPENLEATLSTLTRKYLSGEINEDTYYDLKAKLAVKLSKTPPG
jgi:hypothetical protein